MGISGQTTLLIALVVPSALVVGASREAAHLGEPPTQAQASALEAQLPSWATAPWNRFAVSRSLVISSRLNPFLQRGDFDGDSRPDLAIMVEHTVTKKIGIVFVHRAGGAAHVVGAGIEFGNGGDNFDWVDEWQVEERGTRRTERLLVAKESSASGFIYFDGTRYRWRQRGD